MLRFELLARYREEERLVTEIKAFFGPQAKLGGTLWEHFVPTGSCDHGFASRVAEHLLVHTANQKGLREYGVTPQPVRRPKESSVAAGTCDPLPLEGYEEPGIVRDKRPNALRCDHMVDPLGIDARQPWLSWQFPPDAGTPRAVQLEAADADTGALLWASEWVAPPVTGMRWGGEPVAVRQAVRWRVRGRTGPGRAGLV